MLILTRKVGEKITMDIPPSTEWRTITVEVVDVKPRNDQVRLGFTADREVQIVRDDAKVVLPKRS